MAGKKPTRYKYHYLLRMPMTEAVSASEGGDWVPFAAFTGGSVHSIRFVGGHEWDAVNGWRNTDYSSTAGRSLTCRTSELREAPATFERVIKPTRGYPKPSKPVYRVKALSRVVECA